MQALVRISKRKSVIAKVEGKLRELSHSRGWRLGERELNFESFQQSSQYLTKVRGTFVLCIHAVTCMP